MFLAVRLCHAITTSNRCRMNTLYDEMPCVLQPFSSEENRRCCSIANRLILCSTGSDEHVRNRMLNFCRFKDGDAIVCDHATSFIIDEQFVKTLWSKRGAYCSSKCHCSLDVLTKSVPSCRTVRFLKDRNIAHGRTNGDLHIRSMFSLLHRQLRNQRRRRHRLQH